MNIINCPLKDVNSSQETFCPACHSRQHYKHGTYLRKGFHAPNKSLTTVLPVQRYRCLNEECLRCTFSILPPMVLRYCRFFWPCLLALRQALVAGSTPYHQAYHVWHIGRGAIVRARVLLNQMTSWVEVLHREITDGGRVRKLGFMVHIITSKLGQIELGERWYRHRYPLRFC